MYVIERTVEGRTEYLTPEGEWQATRREALAFFVIAEALQHARNAGGTHVLNTRIENRVAV